MIKRVILAVVFVIAAALTFFGVILFNMKNDASIGIIGGADGPTAIFVAESIFFPVVFIVIGVVAAAIIAAIVLHKKK